MDTNEDNVEHEESCCESSSGGGADYSTVSGGGGGSGRNWKLVVFIVVALLAGAVAAYSFLTNSRCGGRGRPCYIESDSGGHSYKTGSKGPVCPSSKSCCPGAKVSSKGTECTWYKEASKFCPNSPEALAPGCCPGAGYRWGQR